MKRKRDSSDKAMEVLEWFKRSVTYEGEPYVMDEEQVAAVVDESKNTIVVARAGSGKTRTIVAKIVYLVARCGVKPEEIMAFVFNANAAKEINERLGKMMVDGVLVMGGAVKEKGASEDVDDGSDEAKGEKVKIANTFHAFARRVVYDVCKGKERCGKILAGEKEDFVLAIVIRMMGEPKWEGKIRKFMGDEEEMTGLGDDMAEDISGMGEGKHKRGMSEICVGLRG